ncbi:MAG: hypothetical protein NTV38_08950, partial [Chloroflexi bacterium]|nr:hypothetical protein [Chloroflexota bacterium]
MDGTARHSAKGCPWPEAQCPRDCDVRGGIGNGERTFTGATDIKILYLKPSAANGVTACGTGRSGNGERTVDDIRPPA